MPDEIELAIRGALKAWLDGRAEDAAYELRDALRTLELWLTDHAEES